MVTKLMWTNLEASLPPNISFHFKDAIRFESRTHQQITVTIQNPPGFVSKHAEPRQE